MAVRRAARTGMGAMQCFTAIPKYYNERVGVKPERAERFQNALAESGISPEHVVAHAAYVLNTATADDEKWMRARMGLMKELERAHTLGIGAVCFHPGSAGSSAREDAYERVALCITFALEAVNGDTKVLIENTAGAGNTVGRTAIEIAGMLAHVPAQLRKRTGYGLDTCHLYASGIDISHSKNAVTKVLDEFENATGEPPSFFHFNDSEGALGSNKDRHALIGDGAIGEEAFRWILHDRRSEGIPIILETPQQNQEVAEDDDSPDPFDTRMMTLLTGMLT